MALSPPPPAYDWPSPVVGWPCLRSPAWLLLVPLLAAPVGVPDEILAGPFRAALDAAFGPPAARWAENVWLIRYTTRIVDDVPVEFVGIDESVRAPWQAAVLVGDAPAAPSGCTWTLWPWAQVP